MSDLLYNPKVSIVIPAYNASNYLAEAIDSALNQTYSNIEIIVINDGSKDNGATRQIALSYGDKIRYYEKENGGSSSALNLGIANMTGEWFSWLSHDDLYYPDKVKQQIEYLRSIYTINTDFGKNILFCESELIDKDKNLIRRHSKKSSIKKSQFINSIPNNSWLISEPSRFIFCGCGCLVHKCVFEKLGGFDESMRMINDADMWYRIYAAGYKIHFLPQILVQGRVHDKQISKQIGFSYHNPEQDLYWKRSLEWLKKNCTEEYRLFIKYGCNAYLKTRNKEGDEAFEYAKNMNKICIGELCIKKMFYVFLAKSRTLAKKIYINFKIGGAK